MDAAGLIILLAESTSDCGVLQDASKKARARLPEAAPGHLEACAYELGRFYNVLEKMFERICEAFENNFEKRGDYHEKLIQRLTLELKGIRPGFIPRDHQAAIRELKGFHHVLRHAYDLTLRSDRLAELVQITERLCCEVPSWCNEFGRKVRAEQGWSA